ncbi:MAG: hypothetical protein RIF41_11345 [Polyangiaceae bacterium]
MKHPTLLIALFSSLVTAACAGSDTDLETAFCDGLQQPAAKTVDASLDAAAAPDATDASRVDVVLLPQTDGSYGGFVAYRPDESGSFAFGLTEDVDLVFRDASGAEIAIDTTVVGAACDELAVRHSVSLSLDVVTIEIVGSPIETIGLIAEESDDDQS